MLTRLVKAVLGVLVLAMMSACSGGPVASHNIYTEHYAGSFTTGGVVYEVYIDENMSMRDGFVRMVQLRRGDSLTTLTGHSKNSGDVHNWSRVSYCGPRKPGDKAAGCNAVVDDGEGWMFAPCDGDRGKVLPFTVAEIAEAVRVINLAVDSVRTREHLVEQLAWDPVRKMVVRVYPPEDANK